MTCQAHRKRLRGAKNAGLYSNEAAAWLGDTAMTVARRYRNVLVNTLDNISDSLREAVQ